MRYIRYAILAAFMIVIVVLAVANHDMVTLRLLPGALATVYQYSLAVPMYLVMLVTLLFGVILGYVLEWGREMRQRREAAESKRAIYRLERELEALRRKTGEGKDDILAILN